jgi:molybdopterin synthase sulfur carrier subunit
MLTLRFFARVRDQLDCAAMELPWEPGLADLPALERLLVERGGERWARTLAEDNLVRAVNQTVVDADAPLADGDEIAFFPPVTGG